MDEISEEWVGQVIVDSCSDYGFLRLKMQPVLWYVRAARVIMARVKGLQAENVALRVAELEGKRCQIPIPTMPESDDELVTGMRDGGE